MTADAIVSPATDEPLYAYVYRRLVSQIDRRGVINPDAFTLKPGELGLSVFRADIATPYDVLQARIESERAKSTAAKNDDERANSERWLTRNPDVETLWRKGYRIIRLPIADLERMGFALTEPDREGYNAGHLEIRERPENGAVFEDRKQDIVDLLDTGATKVLSEAECLTR